MKVYKEVKEIQVKIWERIKLKFAKEVVVSSSWETQRIKKYNYST